MESSYYPAVRQQQSRQGNPQFFSNYRRDRLPGPFHNYYAHQQPLPFHPPQQQQQQQQHRRPNFVVKLLLSKLTQRRLEAKSLISKLKFKPEGYHVFDRGYVAGSLFYEQWVQALETVVQLWEIRLNGGDLFTPFLKQHVEVSSDNDELRDRLKSLFLAKLKGLFDGELVHKWQKKLQLVQDELKGVTGLLRGHNNLKVYNDLVKKRDGLIKEISLVLKRIEEFKNGVQCLVDYLEGKVDEIREGIGVKVGIYKFGREFNWEVIHSIMTRECRRFDEGLPIFAFRSDILEHIHNQQVTVLIGETGSGKSTQLVQFLADSAIPGNESIICTQPRKLAAISLAQRVKEESHGCYGDNSIACYPSYSSCQRFHPKVIYTTDQCLLQHYMRDRNLSWISCIIVDEAHERSLNTDLLLAVIKNLLNQRLDLRLIIMSATADANQLASYFFGCGTFHVAGRNFPVNVKYVPSETNQSMGSGLIASYVFDVVNMATNIHKTEEDGTILAFLTSQMDVEWACEKFHSHSAIALPLHGKLSYEEQHRVFQNYPGKRKVIFSTNLAETSLTIPGVKYVVDSGLVKESRYEPKSGMNVLKVCQISQSSANQRAGRAGRTEPGTCYRLYSQNDFEIMSCHQEPEIRRVHLGVAVLRILALGVKNVQNFDFVDAPSAEATETALRNLIQLGAVTPKDDFYELTLEGRKLVKLGIEPQLGKLILLCFDQLLGKEGLVLAAVIASSSSIFCRVGTDQSKLKSDCLKIQFCHPSGDLFTLLAVFKEWEALPAERKNIWCWENSINAKAMRRCQDTVQEMENCLQNELNIIIPRYWHWNPQVESEHDKNLKNIILAAFAENVAMYSGYDHLGYEVALTGKHVQLHPSCSLLVFDQRPRWVVFGEILSSSNQYLVCVTGVDFASLSTLRPPPMFDFHKMDSRKLETKVLTGFGSALLKRFCGRYNSSLQSFVSRIRATYLDERISVEVNVDHNEVLLHVSSADMEKVCTTVNNALEYERKLLSNECLEKFLYSSGPTSPRSIALFGSGAEIKHLELEKKCLTVDIFHSSLNCVNDREILMFLERFTSGTICAVQKFLVTGEDNEKEEWGKVTFLTPDAASLATELNKVEIFDGMLKVALSRNIGGDQKMFPYSTLRAKVFWPRRCSKGIAVLKCEPNDVEFMIADLHVMVALEYQARLQRSFKSTDGIMIIGLSKEISEEELFQALNSVAKRRILDLFIVRDNALESPSVSSSQETLLREISSFMPKKNPLSSSVHVQVFEPGPRDIYMRAVITFDGSLYLEAALSLDHINGRVLPGCLPWQKMKCQHLFHSSVSCPAPVYFVIKSQLDALVASSRRQKGVECSLLKNDNGSYRVKISAPATKTVAELRRPIEELMKGTIIDDPEITPTILQLLSSREGILLMRSIERETRTHLLLDRNTFTLRAFGIRNKVEVAKQRLLRSLLALQESKQQEVHLRGASLPPDLMKKVVQRFGPDLHGLKEKFPEAVLVLNTKRHCISICGTKDLRQGIEDIIYEIAAHTSGLPCQKADDDEVSCPICLCEVEDGWKLEGCGHKFCRSCLLEQCECAIKNRDGFPPLRCAYKGCGESVLMTDLRSLLTCEKLDELFRASLSAFVAASGGTYRFCPSPDCPSVYRAADSGGEARPPFFCGACFVETCTSCHVEYHPYMTCEEYQKFKRDPDSTFTEWCQGKENVKKCPVCKFTIEKLEGCDHIECRCGKHICWACLEFFTSSDDCYTHLRALHEF